MSIRYKSNKICGNYMSKITLNKIKEYLNKRRVISMFTDWKTQYCQIYMERQNTPIVKRHERKKNKVVVVILPDLKTYYKAIIIKIAWHL